MSYYLFIEFTIIRYRFINTSVSPPSTSTPLPPEPQQCSSGLSFTDFGAVVVLQEILIHSQCSSLQHEFNSTSHILLWMDNKNKKKVDKYCKSSFDQIPGQLWLFRYCYGDDETTLLLLCIHKVSDVRGICSNIALSLLDFMLDNGWIGGGRGLEAQVGIVPFKVIHCNIHSMKIVLSCRESCSYSYSYSSESI